MRKMYFSPYTQPFCPVKSAPWNESSHQNLNIGDYDDDDDDEISHQNLNIGDF